MKQSNPNVVSNPNRRNGRRALAVAATAAALLIPAACTESTEQTSNNTASQESVDNRPDIDKETTEIRRKVNPKLMRIAELVYSGNGLQADNIEREFVDNKEFDNNYYNAALTRDGKRLTVMLVTTGDEQTPDTEKFTRIAARLETIDYNNPTPPDYAFSQVEGNEGIIAEVDVWQPFSHYMATQYSTMGVNIRGDSFYSAESYEELYTEGAIDQSAETAQYILDYLMSGSNPA